MSFFRTFGLKTGAGSGYTKTFRRSALAASHRLLAWALAAAC